MHAEPVRQSDRLPEALRMGAVHLRVPDIGRSLKFYEGLLGMATVNRDQGTVTLGPQNSAERLVVLHESPDAVLRPRRSTGLFHMAILYPDRHALAGAFRRLHEQAWPFGGFADHGVSEALYLADPDGIGIELYADRPKKQWPIEQGKLAMGTWELDLQHLLGELTGEDVGWKGMPGKTSMGHVHLNVADISASEKFYADAMGFDIMARWEQSALFVSAGGYHHHLGLNVWNGRGAPPPPENTVGLERFEIHVGSEEGRRAVHARLEAGGYHPGKAGSEGLLVVDPNGIRVSIH